MKRARLWIGLLVFAVMAGWSSGSAVFAESPSALNEFPIGIFYQPPAGERTDARYAEIRDMHANFVMTGKDTKTLGANKWLLEKAAANGLKVLVEDLGTRWNKSELIYQKQGDLSLMLDKNHPIGQTFKTPNSQEKWAVDHVSIQVDPTQWHSNVTVTLSVYDSPGKNTLIGAASISGPGSVPYPEFIINKWLENINTTYYMELTTDSESGIPVKASSNDGYADGALYANGMQQTGDLLFEMNMIHWKAGLSATEIPSDTYLQALTNYYKSNPALLGYLMYDEPTPKLFANLATATNKMKSFDPNHMVYVNLAGAGVLSDRNYDGNDVTPTSPIGQTFRTGNISEINSIQIWIDNGTWGPGEALTLTLWDSPAKGTKIAESTLSSTPTSYWPTFSFIHANVSPNTMYYYELTHNGGGDQKIGWAIRSVIGENWVEGTAYIAGQPIDADWWFAINGEDQSLQEYESIVSRWADTHPDVLSFDAYPYRTDGGLDADGIHSSYYPTLEAMRKVSAEKGIDVWSYIQSVGITDRMKVPTDGDMRYQIYSNLAYGVKGLIYFTYWTPPNEWGEPFTNGIINANGNRTDLYGYAKTVNADVLKLGPTLMKLHSQAVYHTGPTLPISTSALPGTFYLQLSSPTKSTVIGSFTDGTARKYVMVVNKDRTNSQSIAFTLPGKPQSVKEISKATGTEVATNYLRFTGNLTVTFAPGEGKLFVIDEVAPNQAPVAHDSALSTKRNTPISSTFKASDANQDRLRYSIVTNGTKGTATIIDAETGTFTYTPKNSGVSGEDTIKFQANDGIGISNIGTVTITIRKEK